MTRKRKLILVVVIIALLILLVPISMGQFDDGGTVVYSAVLYTVHNRRTLWEEDGYDGVIVGIQVRILGRMVFDNTRFERFERR